jgi:hypothetical protein
MQQEKPEESKEKPEESKEKLTEPKEKPRQTWHVCCSETDPEFIKYVSQSIVSAAVMGLAIIKLAQGSEDALYPSLLTMILGVYVPTPTHRAA